MKKTGIQKVLGRKDYTIKVMTIYKNPKITEVLVYKDFTGTRP